MKHQKIKALPRRITREMRAIITGIKQGRLEHEQSMYHCGTKHCIAGWAIVLMYEATRYRYKTWAKLSRNARADWPIATLSSFVASQLKGLDLLQFREMYKGSYWASMEWILVSIHWQLTPAEQASLFWGDRKLSEIEDTVTRLEKGQRRLCIDSNTSIGDDGCGWFDPAKSSATIISDSARVIIEPDGKLLNFTDFCRLSEQGLIYGTSKERV